MTDGLLHIIEPERYYYPAAEKILKSKVTDIVSFCIIYEHSGIELNIDRIIGENNVIELFIRFSIKINI